MDDLETFGAIVAHGLSVRQIPLQNASLFGMSHHEPGNEIVETELNPMYYDYHLTKHRDSEDFRIDEVNRKAFRRYTKFVKVPQFAGYWMCQQVRGTSSSVTWSRADDNLAPTLNESVALFVSKLTKGR